MTTVKLDSKLPRGALAHIADKLFANLGTTIVAVVELRSAERTEPEDTDDKERSVKLKVTTVEVGEHGMADVLRRIAADLYRARTSEGTLDEAASILRDGTGLLTAADADLMRRAALDDEDGA